MKSVQFPIISRVLATLFLSAVMLTSSFAQPEYWKREGWKTDFSKTTIDYSEIMSGGPPRDGIPPIDRPHFLKVSDYKELSDRDPVIGLEINGDARAYPLRVMIWHEIANDVVGGKPVTITYCPLCNAAIVFDATVDGKVLDFGTTGKLRNSDLIMYDRATQSWWQQFTGEAIAGEYTGTALKFVPARLESWADFSKRHPDGKVLVPNDPMMRSYGRNPYVNYDISPVPFLYRGDMQKGISPMSKVVVVRGKKDTTPYVVTLQHVRENGPIKHGDVTVSWKKGQASALNGAQISESTDVGTISVVRNSGDGDKIIFYDLEGAMRSYSCSKELYRAYLLASCIRYSGLALSEVSPTPLSHDAVSRWLKNKRFSPKDVWSATRDLVDLDAPCLLLGDDSVLDKRHSRKIETVGYQYSGNAHDIIAGIGMVNMVWCPTQNREYLPVDFRVYDKDSDGKTKNSHCRDMLKVAKTRGFKPDAWYSSLVFQP